MTSHDCVAIARRALGTKKVGHAGTLDPMATGILVLGFGNGTFSTQNQAVNATGFTNQLVLTPALFYFFKTIIFLLRHKCKC